MLAAVSNRISKDGIAPAPSRIAALEWVVGALVVAVNAALAAWSPLLIPPDGPDYLDGAWTLAHGAR